MCTSGRGGPQLGSLSNSFLSPPPAAVIFVFLTHLLLIFFPFSLYLLLTLLSAFSYFLRGVCFPRAQFWGLVLSLGKKAVDLLARWFHRTHQKDGGARWGDRNRRCPQRRLCHEGGTDATGRTSVARSEFSQEKGSPSRCFRQFLKGR